MVPSLEVLMSSARPSHVVYGVVSLLLAACDGVRPAQPGAAPAAPTGLTATAAAGSVRVAWTAVAGATKYDVHRATQSSGTYTRVTSPSVTATSWTDAAVTAGATYWYEVTAVGTGGESGVSAAASATVPSGTPIGTVPAAPANLTAAVASDAVSLSWSAVFGATGYDVWRAAASAGPFTRLTAATQAATTYRDAAVASGSTYWYQATATNATGTSLACAAVSAVVPPVTVTVSLSPTSGAVDACAGTLTFTAAVAGATNTAVTWSVREGAAGGTVDAGGHYTAPATAGAYHVVATSAASTTATATVTVSERVLSMTVSPTSLSLVPGDTGQFTATVTTTCGATITVQPVTAPL
jgi:hypothetical protein